MLLQFLALAMGRKATSTPDKAQKFAELKAMSLADLADIGAKPADVEQIMAAK